MKGTVIAMDPADAWRRAGVWPAFVISMAAIVGGCALIAAAKGPAWLWQEFPSLPIALGVAVFSQAAYHRFGRRRIRLTENDLQIRDVTHEPSSGRRAAIVVPRRSIVAIDVIEPVVIAEPAVTPPAPAGRPWFVDVSRGTPAEMRRRERQRERDGLRRDADRKREAAESRAARLRPTPNVRITVRDGHDVYLRTRLVVRMRVWWTTAPKKEPNPPTEILVDVLDPGATVALTRKWLADTRVVATELSGARTH